MKRLQSVVISFLVVIPATCFAQARRAPVYVSHAGQDSVGALFEAALNQELSRSILYIPRSAKGANGKFEFHIDLRTVDVADSKSEQGKRSVVSVVIEDFGPIAILLKPCGITKSSSWTKPQLLKSRRTCCTTWARHGAATTRIP